MKTREEILNKIETLNKKIKDLKEINTDYNGYLFNIAIKNIEKEINLLYWVLDEPLPF